jgi:prepilin-type N-terminal cleavage/methylation domain-containing protein
MLQVRRVPLNRKGLTLVEMLVAMVVLLIVFLALMQTALVSIGYNMNNVLRDEAVSIADERMNNARSLFTPTADNLQNDIAAMVHIKSDGTTTNVDASTECPTGWPHGNTGVYVERNLKNIQNFGFCTFRTVTQLDSLVPTQNKQVTIDVRWTWKGQAFQHSYTTIVGRQ